MVTSRSFPLLGLAFAGVLSALAPGGPARGLQPEEPGSLDPEVVENLAAFARLYGYVRYFHPSDQGMQIDWDAFAIHGTRTIQDMEGSDGLQETLETLFLPVAPSIQIYPSDREAPPPLDLGAGGSGYEVVAWQHEGAPTGYGGERYRSVRANAGDRLSADGTGIGTFFQTLTVTGRGGHRIRVRAQVRAVVGGRRNGAGVWVRFDQEGRPAVGTGTRTDPPIRREAWTEAEVVADIPEDADGAVVGGFLIGSGGAWFDGVDVSVEDESGSWIPMPLENPGFEAGQGEGCAGWDTRNSAYSFFRMEGGPEGGHACQIFRGPDIEAETLFDEVPEMGEVVEREIGGGLSARVPLALWRGAEGTVSPPSPYSLEGLQAELKAFDPARLDANDPALRMAGITVAWNILQHFYAYFDVVDVDWPAQLRPSLREALDADGPEEFYVALRHMVAKLDDSHAFVNHPVFQTPGGKVPLGLDWIEDHVVVTVSSVPQVQPGDVVLSLDGVDVNDLIRMDEEELSGSPQYVRSQAVWRRLGRGPEGTTAEMVLRRGGETVEVEVRRGPWEILMEEKPGPVDELAEGILYVDMAAVTGSDLRSAYQDLVGARAVIFDLRFTNAVPSVAGFLMDEPHGSRDWLVIPHTIYPDHERPLPGEPVGIGPIPTADRLRGQAVFLINAQTLGPPEADLAFVEHYGLGEIVGSPTAGSLAGVHSIPLPGEYSIPFTVQRGTKPDGTRHHGVGVRPTVPVERTIQGVRDGRDEVLEAALRILGGTR